MAGSTAAPQSRFGPLESYTPKHLVEEILTSKAALEGERKLVTVLFADLKGSMELLADRDPEEARRLLDPVLERMMEAVHRYEGTVNQVMGDGIMALFGAPLAHEDHAVRACYAALQIHDSIERLNPECPTGGGIQVRIGLNSGEVVVRAIRNDVHLDYSAIGETTHLAARLEQLARPGTTVITDRTLRLVQGFVDVKPLGVVQLKGLNEPMSIYELVGARATRTRLEATASVRGLTPFVGRLGELNGLRDLCEQARRGRGQVVALVGEPGVGKSRLVYEFARTHGAQASSILEGRSVPYGRQTAYLPIVELLRFYFRIGISDTVREIRKKVMEKLLALDLTLENAVPAFLWLFDVPADDGAWEELAATDRRRRTVDALKRLFVAESQIRPLLLVFEDLHWIDTETETVLDVLIPMLSTTRIMMIVSYRPDYAHRWSGRAYYTEIRIDPLPRASAEELLDTLVGREPALQPLKRFLVERTDGNPFFLEESVRALLETRQLVADRDAYGLITSPEKIQIPGSVQAILAARIDRLGPSDKRLLQAAAVIGKDVPWVLIRAVSALSPDELNAALLRLQAAEFVYETALFPEREYTFKHSLTHDVAYAGLLHDQRKGLHTSVVDAIERLYPERLAEHVEALARHAVLGEAWERAVRYLLQAGLQAARRSAHHDAVALFDQALEALRWLPATRERAEQAIDLHFAARNSLWPLWDHPKIFEHLTEAERLATELADRPRLGRVYSFMIQHHRINGEPDRAIQAGELALAIARDVGDSELQIDTHFRLGLAYMNLGEYGRAVDLLRSNIVTIASGATYERFGQPGLPAVLSRAWLALCLAEVGQFGEAAAHGAEAVSIAATADHGYSLISAHVGLGGAQLYRGELPQAVETLKEGLALCRKHEIPVLFRLVASQLGYALALSGDLNEAVSLLEEAAEADETARTMARHTLYVAWLAEAFLLQQRFDEAWTRAAHALDLARARRERGHEAWAHRIVAELQWRGSRMDLDAADVSYRAVVDLADRLAMRPLTAIARLGWSHVHGRLGRPALARTEVAAASAVFQELRMPFWLARAQRTRVELERIDR